jgi:uncharacterized protein (TIGR02147 family)
MKRVFDFDSYRDFLRNQFPPKGDGRGQRKNLAEHIQCQTSFISLVLTDRAHMSEEMLLGACEFLKLTRFETDFLLLLLHYERAGTKKLEHFYQQKIEVFRSEQSEVEEALSSNENELSSEQQIQYYSSWIYPAVHVATMIGKGTSFSFLEQALSTDLESLQEATEFLLNTGLIVKKNSLFICTKKRMHLSRSSPLSVISHTSWRLESIRHLQKMKEQNLHYSSIYTLSKKDYVRIKKALEAQILACEKIIAPSKEETLCVLSIDLFSYFD